MLPAKSDQQGLPVLLEQPALLAALGLPEQRVLLVTLDLPE